MQTRRVVITSVGAITAQGRPPTPCGTGFAKDTWRSAPVAPSADGWLPHHPRRRGRPAPPARLRLPHPGSAHRANPPSTTPADRRRGEAMAGVSVRAADGEALPGALPAERWGMAFGTCNAGLHSGEQVMRAVRERPMTAEDAAHLIWSRRRRWPRRWRGVRRRGPVLSVNTACAVRRPRASRTPWRSSGPAGPTPCSSAAPTPSPRSRSPGSTALGVALPAPGRPVLQGPDGLSLGEGSGMLVLLSRMVAERRGRPGARRGARLRPVRRRLPPDGAAPPGRGRRPGDPRRP